MQTGSTTQRIPRSAFNVTPFIGVLLRPPLWTPNPRCPHSTVERPLLQTCSCIVRLKVPNISNLYFVIMSPLYSIRERILLNEIKISILFIIKLSKTNCSWLDHRRFHSNQKKSDGSKEISDRFSFRENMKPIYIHITCLVYHINILMRITLRENMPSHFKVKEYCPLVFRNLRERFGIHDREYLVSKQTFILYNIVLPVASVESHLNDSPLLLKVFFRSESEEQRNRIYFPASVYNACQ